MNEVVDNEADISEEQQILKDIYSLAEDFGINPADIDQSEAIKSSQMTVEKAASSLQSSAGEADHNNKKDDEELKSGGKYKIKSV